MATDPAVQAAAKAAHRALCPFHACSHRVDPKSGDYEIARAVLAAVTPLIRAQAFIEAADAIQTTRTGGGWENNINIGLHKAELLVRGLGEGTANR